MAVGCCPRASAQATCPWVKLRSVGKTMATYVIPHSYNATANRDRRQDFLISPEIFLIARFNSLQGRKKFPARISRELARQPFGLAPLFAPFDAPLSPQSTKFPASSQPAGNFASETGSLETASSTGESHKPSVPRGRLSQSGTRSSNPASSSEESC